MAYHFALVFSFAIASVAIVLGLLLLGKIVRPNHPDSEKASIYECGEKPIGQAWFNFNPRFYVVALIFVIFEVEIALMLPVVLVYQSMVGQGLGGLAFAEILVFLGILAVGLAWVWAKGDLDWIKRLGAGPDDGQ